MSQALERNPVEPRATRHPSLAGTQVGNWLLLNEVSSGGDAVVYRARPWASTGEACYAIKLLSSAYEHDICRLELFCQEVRVGRSVSHPHLVPILAASIYEPPFHLVMPWLEGATLGDRIAAGELIALPRALWIARQVAEALVALHREGWLHADVKPANIMVATDGHATLMDLGFAQRVCEVESADQRLVLGTSAYMAPEMLSSTMGIDIRSDLYSLGVTLFEAITGRLPYHADDIADLAVQHRQGLRGDLRKHMPCVPTSVARLVRQLLARDPMRRPQTPQEVVERLVSAEIETFSER